MNKNLHRQLFIHLVSWTGSDHGVPHCLKSRSALAEPQMHDGTLLDVLVQT